MPELRKDPVSGRWVIISTERSKRPDDFVIKPLLRVGTFEEKCPYDEGREDRTCSEILSYRRKSTAKDSPGWWVRVVPCGLPLMKIEGNLERRGVGMFDMMNGIGAHEFIVETPRHEQHLPDMDEAQIEKILWAYRDRIIDLYRDKRIKYVFIFKNHLINPELTYHHSLSQLIALPILPKHLKEEMAGAKAYYDFKERCLYCDIIRQEIADGERVVDENRNFLLFIPYASRSPFEVNIMPKSHSSSYTSISKEEVMDLAVILKRYLKRIKAALNDPPYNLMLHTRPAFVSTPHKVSTIDKDYHWHIEVVPTLTKLAGFEWGSGFYINPTSPEDGAEFLRNLKDY
jgi:UDPglucose--hexose-1-phosphate uridylyltransferase